MIDAMKSLLIMFGLIPENTAVMTVADGFVYLITAVFSLIFLYLFIHLIFTIIKFFLSAGGGTI